MPYFSRSNMPEHALEQISIAGLICSRFQIQAGAVLPFENGFTFTVDEEVTRDQFMAKLADLKMVPTGWPGPPDTLFFYKVTRRLD